MIKPQTRRTFLKRLAGSFLTVLGLGAGGYVYGNRIEPALLGITRLEISHPLIPAGFHGKKIIQFSDTHLGFQYNLNQLDKLINKINAEKPDLIFFTGDLMDEPNKYREINKLTGILQKLQAPLGKYCIYGNHDHGGYGTEIYRGIMEAAGFKLLINSADFIKLPDNSRIFIAGIDDLMLGKPDLASALKHVPEKQFCILLSHEPDFAETAMSYPVQWQLSGHSHGGQVKIPFAGALVLPPFAKIYQEGLYAIGGENGLILYVNRGIGTTGLPFRFFSKPELSVFTLSAN
ncbi:metallophosphoesterase [Bacillus sp. FJAT-29814]|uniref:metallophosphoesterase n=1 Tax=Bacillus sp. FJAT-29814 TaxID=1729688 RepID=UPI000831B077|nr:metallophosphoesterase [Bacillus sp. FJAT-29814]